MVATRVPAATEKSGADASDSGALDRAVQMLALLQRDGRLVDFLEEDVSSYPDGQLGAAVRTIHSSCRQFWNATSNSNRSFLPRRTIRLRCRWAAAIKLIGSVTGQPPIRH